MEFEFWLADDSNVREQTYKRLGYEGFQYLFSKA